MGFSGLVVRHMTDSRAKTTQLPLADLLPRSIYSRMASYEMSTTPNRWHKILRPHDRFGEDLRAWAPLTSRLRSFETELLTQDNNLAVWWRSIVGCSQNVESIDSPRQVVPDMDSTEIRAL